MGVSEQGYRDPQPRWPVQLRWGRLWFWIPQWGLGCGAVPLQPPVTQGPDIPQLPAGTGWGVLGGSTPGLTLPNPSETPAVSACPSAHLGLDRGWSGWLKGLVSTGDREVPWGREPLHSRLLWERGTCAV